MRKKEEGNRGGRKDKLRLNKSVSLDGIPNEVWEYGGEEMKQEKRG